MKYNRLGTSGLVVSKLTFGGGSLGVGTNILGLKKNLPEKQATEIVSRCIDAGVTSFDTSDDYLFGQSETVLGKALGTRRRDVVLATKTQTPFGPREKNMGGLSYRRMIQACDDSLRRLQTDYIDLYQTHWPDHGMQQEETLGALTDLIDQGKIRAWGSSNETCWGVMKNLWEAEKHGLARMATVQNNFSLINRRCESELAQVCRKEGVSLLPYSPLGGGVLCGKYNGGALPKGARFTDYIQNGGPRQKMMAARFVNERSLETTARLQIIAADLGVSVTALALAWSKQHDFVASTIVGATTVAQLNDSLAAADLVLSAETLGRINEIDAAIPCAMTEDGLRRL